MWLLPAESALVFWFLVASHFTDYGVLACRNPNQKSPLISREYKDLLYRDYCVLYSMINIRPIRFGPSSAQCHEVAMDCETLILHQKESCLQCLTSKHIST